MGSVAPRNHVVAYLSQIVGDTVAWMSGSVGLAFTVTGLFVPRERLPGGWEPVSFLWASVGCLFVASYRAWLAAHRTSLSLGEQLRPKLEFFRVNDQKPFFEVLAPQNDPGNNLERRRVRVGLRNGGGSDIRDVRVVLESCVPSTAHGVHLEQEMAPMGQPQGTSRCILGAGGQVIIDVAHETRRDQLPVELRLCYAQDITNELPVAGNAVYSLTLRAEGGGLASRCRLSLGDRLTWTLDSLESVVEP